MVTPSQFLERPTLIAAGREVLEGLWHRGTQSPPVLLVPPRPEEGGGMDHVVNAELVWAANLIGHPTLRFNFPGVGASQGCPGELPALVQAAEAALQLLMENTGSNRVAVVSVEGGAQVALHLAAKHPEVVGLCLVSPRDVAFPEVAELKRSSLVVAGQEDPRLPRSPLSRALAEEGIDVEWMEDTGPTFPRSLALVGKRVAHWLQALSRS